MDKDLSPGTLTSSEKYSLGITNDSSNGEQSGAHEPTDHLLRPRPDLEAQFQCESASKERSAYGVGLLWLVAWLLLNLALTISNKAVLSQVNTPWLLTTVHSSSTSIGCFILVGTGSIKLSQFSRHDAYIIAAFSVLFTVNIATSNVSLGIVSIPFHQVMRSTCPVATVVIYRILGHVHSTATYLSIVPLVVGVAIATFGDYYCTVSGFVLTFSGVVLAAVKTVATNRLMNGTLKLGALELLLHMSPLATMQCVAFAFAAGEVETAHWAYLNEDISTSFILALFANGVIAFLLNVVSFQANKMTGALTMTIAGNTKQVLTILLGIVFFNVRIGPANGAGIIITLVGAALYSMVELKAKTSKRRQTGS